MNSALQFHLIHGEHIKLSKNNSVAKRVESFCKGICFSHRPVGIREKIHVRLVTKSVQWTGFLRLGMTTSDPITHRTATSLPRHACPDLTCRPGYWAKCVPENCFDLNNKTTYFYVDEHGELFLNTPTGEISLLTGISINEPLWALLDIYGNCVSIEICDFGEPRSRSRPAPEPIQTNPVTFGTQYFRDYQPNLQVLPFSSECSSSITFPTVDSFPTRTIVRFDQNQTEGIVYMSESIKINMGFILKIFPTMPTSDNNSRLTTSSNVDKRARTTASIFQIGLTNFDINNMTDDDDLPLSIEQINSRSEFWPVEDCSPIDKTNIENGDEFLFVLNNDGVLQYSHNNSKFNDFIHIDPHLNYFPFLVLKTKSLTISLIGFIRDASGIQARLKTTAQASNSLDSIIRNECSICMDKPRDTVLIPCGHICTCNTCANGLLTSPTRKCPICRVTIELINRIFLP